MVGIIYKYTNKINNKVYIGQTYYEEKRKQAHFFSPADNKFHKAIHYYGWMNFDYEVIETVDESELSNREIYWIKYYDSVNNGYNTKTRSCIDALEKKLILKDKEDYHISTLPFGYEHRNKDGKVYINEENANIIRNIFNDYLDGYSLKELDNKYKITVHGIIHNEKYKGNDIFPQIISEKIFDEVQNKCTSHKPRRRIKCVIDGVEYSSILQASKKLGIDRRQIMKIINGEKTEIKEKHKCIIDGVEYRSISDATRKLGISYRTAQVLCGHRKVNPPKKCIIDGVEYRSINAAVKELGLNRRKIMKMMDK